MDIIVKKTLEAGEQQKQGDSTIEASPATSELTDSQMADLADFLDTRLYELCVKDKEKLRYIFNAARKGGGDFDEVMNTLRKVRVKIGAPNFNERTIDKFYKYFKLLSQFNSLGMAIKAEERGQ